MIYSNDETDKSIRQKNFYLTVYLVPVAIAAIISGLVYLAAKAGYLTYTDTMYGYVLSLTPASLLYTFNRRNWLKMPDGTYHNIKGISSIPNISANEPTEYEAEYFYSKKQKVISTLSGIALISAAVWLGVKSSKSILVPVGTGAGGIFLAYAGVKGLFDKTAKLKLAKTGLWTKKLGYIDYRDISKAQVIEDTSGRSPQTILEIYLKGTVFAEANQPDERLILTDVEDKQFVEMVLDNLMNKRNEPAI